MPTQTDRLNAALDGRYRIERHLGEGGMASVYLCQDLKHDRKVALKLLKPELAAVLGAERFVVEIKTTASLQHPHILPLFDSGTADGFLFYVMPYIQGETLREKLNRETQLGVDEAVKIARDVADALDYAHRHGVIHRDIKPENILLHDGRPMVADFGIALAVSAAAGGRMTETGLSLGTPHYMSPEQATAEREITARSDVYSLGTVLFEMLTGNPPHTGASAQQIIMKIITEPAEPVTKYRKSVPPNVAAAVAKSLEKLPADRFESAKAFADALGNPSYTSARSGGTAAATMQTRGVSLPVFAGTIAVLAAAVIVAAVWGRRTSASEDSGTVVRFALTLGPDIQASTGAVAISPDGNTIVFHAVRAGVRMLYARTLGDASARAIPGTEDAGNLVFSPDGRWLAFVALGQLKKVQLSGGAVVPLGAVTLVRGAAWTKDDVILLGTTRHMFSIPATGGTTKMVVPLDTAHGEESQRYPLVLDDGETVVFTSWHGNVAASQLGVLTRSTGKVRFLDLPGSTCPLAVVEGKLIYASATGSLMAVPFDARSARVTGAPVPVLDGVSLNPVNGGVAAAISANGSLVYQTGVSTSQLVLAELNGRAEVVVSEAKNYSFPRFSRDGKRIAFGVTTTTSTDVWLYDIAARTPTRLTSEGSADRPEWTPDGKRVLYYATGRRDQRAGALWWQPSDGSGTAELVQVNPRSGVNEGVISPDGHILAYRLNGGGVTEDLWYRRLDGDTASKQITATRFQEHAPRFSPDGRWMAYTSDQSGTFEVYVQAFPALGARIQVTAGGGQTPIWSSDGRHIYYVANGQMNVATVTTTPTFAVTSRQRLFEGNYTFGTPVHAQFDIAPDGQHILLIRPTTADAQTFIVHDWKYELRERTATAKSK